MISSLPARAWQWHKRFASAATAPGGLAEMSLTAAVLNLGVPLVTAYHVIRIIMITMLTLPAYRLSEKLFASRPSETL